MWRLLKSDPLFRNDCVISFQTINTNQDKKPGFLNGEELKVTGTFQENLILSPVLKLQSREERNTLDTDACDSKFIVSCFKSEIMLKTDHSSIGHAQHVSPNRTLTVHTESVLQSFVLCFTCDHTYKKPSSLSGPVVMCWHGSPTLLIKMASLRHNGWDSQSLTVKAFIYLFSSSNVQTRYRDYQQIEQAMKISMMKSISWPSDNNLLKRNLDHLAVIKAVMTRQLLLSHIQKWRLRPAM